MSDPKKLYKQIQKIMRVTPQENELIKQRMAYHNFSNFNTYARYMLLTGEVVKVDYSELIKLRTEINRIGTNINQLAKYVNTNEEISLESYQSLQDSLSEIKQMMNNKIDKEMSLTEKLLKERRG